MENLPQIHAAFDVLAKGRLNPAPAGSGKRVGYLRLRLLTGGLAGALVCAPVMAEPGARTTQPRATAVECGIAVLVIAVGAVMIYGLWRMCDKIPKPPPPPQTNIPPTIRTNLPHTNRAMAFVMPLSQTTLTGSTVTLQHQDSAGGNWINDAVFTRVDGVSNSVITASTPSGKPLGTLTAPFVDGGDGQQWGSADFSAVLAKTIQPAPRRFYRLVAQ